MTSFIRLPYVAGIALSIVLFGCKKDDTGPQAIFAINPTSASIGTEVNFINQSKNGSDFQWQFGDGELSFDENPTHIYTISGTFTVTLKVIGNGSSNTTTQSIIISVPKNIFEGKSVDKVELGDSWDFIKSTFTQSDTLSRTIYNDDLGVYLHLVYFPVEGLIFYFFSGSPQVIDQDMVEGISAVEPFIGATQKGIFLGNKMNSVKILYGNSTTHDEGDYQVISYANYGVDYFSYTSPFSLIEEILIYSASSSIAQKKVITTAKIQKITSELMQRKFRN